MSVAGSDGPGGMLVRRMVPAFSATLLILGRLRLLGQTLGFYGLHVGLAGLVVASILRFRVITGWTAMALDKASTHQQIAEAAMRERELRYRSIVDATFDGIVVSESGTIREVNPGLATMFGYDLDELIGKPLMDLAADESRPALAERMRKAEGGSYETVGRRKDGGRIYLDLVVKVHDRDGRQIRVTALHPRHTCVRDPVQ